ncbi:hypothetical protein OAQ40_00015 [Euryarchaeota archaeon]|nr:hypothetical protein [Euryarchaeota archaeon]
MSITFKTAHEFFLGEKADVIVRRIAIISAIVGFSLHLLFWILIQADWLKIFGESSEMFHSPLSSLYTPFSILLAYEVYQLIRTIPESFSSSVGKQYEIATLLVVRDILKRLSNVESQEGWVIDDDLLFLVIECVAFLVLFYTSLVYHRISKDSKNENFESQKLSSFIYSKEVIASLMLIVFIVITFTSMTGWIESVMDGKGSVNREIFFLDFFTFLILADILILLISYWFYTDFGNLARNTGFVLSTVIIRVAISSPGVSAMFLFGLSGIIGIAIIRISINDTIANESLIKNFVV